MALGFAALVALWWIAHALRLPLPAAVAGLVLVNFAPGWAAIRLAGFRGRSLAWRVTAAGVLSPPLLGALGLLAGLAGLAPEIVTWPVVALAVLLLFLPDRSREPREESPGIERALLAGLVALALLHPRLPRWSDSWFHAAVFHEVQRAGIHATFPHFADMPLPYPWFFHLYLVMAAPLVNGDPFVLIATVNQLTAFLLPVAFYALARALGMTPRIAARAPVAGVLGVNPLGPLILLVRSFTGETGGPEVLSRALADADAIQGGLAFHFPGFQTSWLARLWTPSAFNFGLVLAAFVLMLVPEYLRERRGRTLALFTTALALLLHWHTLTALHLSMGIAVGVAFAAAPRLRADGLRALGRGERAWAVGALAGLAAPMLVFDLPGMADEKLYWPLFLPVAALAAPGLAALWSGASRGRALLAGLLALSVLNTGLTGFAFLRDSRSLRAMFDAGRPEGAAFYTPDERAALEWIRERSPRDAVFLQPLRPAGTEPILVHGERRLWLGFAEVFYRATFFESSRRPPIPQAVWDELQRRDAAQRRAFGAEPLTAAELDSLRARPWPLYVWWDSSLAGGRLSPTLVDTARVTREVFASPSVRILEVRR